MAYSLVERSEANYRIVYGSHNRITPVSELPSKYDALFLEGLYEVNEMNIGDGFKFLKDTQYDAIASDAQEKNINLYFGDFLLWRSPFSIKIGDSEFPQCWSDVMRLGEIAGGQTLLLKFLTRNGKKEISRRDFLKISGGGIGYVWTMSYLNTLISYLFEEGKELPRVLEEIVAWENPLHPEDIRLWFRNAVAAKKLMTIGKTEKMIRGQKSEVVANFGGAHTGIVEFLRKGEKACEEVVKFYPYWFLEEMIEDLDSVSVVTQASFDSQIGFWIVSRRFLDEGLYFSINREKENTNLRKESMQ